MTTRIVGESEFAERLRLMLADEVYDQIGMVTGPGRSGALASVYASHMLMVPFLPYGQKWQPQLGRLLIVDTARQTGKTLRKAERKYEEALPLVLVCYEEPPRVAFWYEAPKPQRYRHELRSAA